MLEQGHPEPNHEFEKLRRFPPTIEEIKSYGATVKFEEANYPKLGQVQRLTISFNGESTPVGTLILSPDTDRLYMDPNESADQQQATYDALVQRFTE